MQDGSERRRLPSTPDRPRGPARSPALEPMHGVRGIAEAIAFSCRRDLLPRDAAAVKLRWFANSVGRDASRQEDALVLRGP
jgi:hypothetical protein